MSHLTAQLIHAFKDRAQDIRIAVETEETTADFTAITFTGGGIEKTPLSADDTPLGFNVDLTLTATDLDIDAGLYPWELTATLAGEIRSLARGTLRIDP